MGLKSREPPKGASKAPNKYTYLISSYLLNFLSTYIGADEEGMSTKSTMGFGKTIMTIFGHLKCLFLFFYSFTEIENQLLSSMSTMINQIWEMSLDSRDGGAEGLKSQKVLLLRINQHPVQSCVTYMKISPLGQS